MTDTNIIHFSEAAQRLRDKRGQSAGLSLLVDNTGCLNVLVVGPRGERVADVCVPADESEKLVHELAASIRLVKLKRAQDACKHAKVTLSTEMQASTCMSCGAEIGKPRPSSGRCPARDSANARCRRRGHEDETHRNENGEFRCLHAVWSAVRDAGGSVMCCGNCGKRRGDGRDS